MCVCILAQWAVAVRHEDVYVPPGGAYSQSQTQGPTLVFQRYDPLTETGGACVFPVDPLMRIPWCLNAWSVPAGWTLALRYKNVHVCSGGMVPCNEIGGGPCESQ